MQTIEVNVHKKASKYTILSKVLEAGGHPKRLEECENVREVRVQKASGGKPLLFIRESASLAKAVGQGSAKEGTSSASNTDTKYLVRIMPTHMSSVDVRFHLFAPRPEDALTGAVKLLKIPAVSELYAFVVIDLSTGTMPLHKRREKITEIPLTSTPVTVHPKATESSTPTAKVTAGSTTSVKGVRHTLRHSVLSQEFVGLQPPVTTRVKLPSVTVKQSLRGTNA